MGKPLRCSVLLLLALLPLGPRLARAGPDEDLEDPQAMAQAYLLKRNAEGADGALAWLNEERHDPWIVAEGLLLAGKKDVAQELAAAKPSADATDLIRYVAREEAPPTERAEAVLEAEALLDAGNAEGALARLGSLEGTPRTVTEVRARVLGARVLYALDRKDEAIDVLMAARTGAAAAMGWDRGVIAASQPILGHLGWRERPDLQLDILRGLVDIDPDVHDLGRSALWCLRVGRLESLRGRPRQARAWLLEATGLFDSLADTSRLTEELASERLRAIAKLADVQLEVGEVGEAMSNARSAYRDRAEARGEVRAMLPSVLAKANQALGHLDLAEEGFKEAAGIAEKEKPEWYPLLLGEQAQVLVEKGEIPAALKLYDEVGTYPLSPSAEYVRRLSVVAARLADTDPKGEEERLRHIHEEILTLITDLSKEPPGFDKRPEIEISANTFLGEVLDRQKQPNKAVRYLVNALAIPYARVARRWQPGCRRLLARCYRHAGNTAGAMEQLQDVLRGLERQIEILPATTACSRLTRGGTRELVEECLAVAKDAGTPEALQWALESTHGMLYMLEAQQRREEEAGNAPTAPSLVVSDLRRAIAKAARTYWEADAAGQDDVALQAQNRLAEARAQLRKEEEWDDLEQVVKEDSGKRPPPDADSPFRRHVPALEDDEAFLYYEPCEDGVLVGAVVRGRIRGFFIEDRRALTELVREARKAWHERSPTPAGELLTKRLAEMVLPPELRDYVGILPADRTAGTAHIYISAGGPLTALPWELLLQQLGRNLPTVSFAASQAVLASIKTWNPKPTGDALLALGDPDYTVVGREGPQSTHIERELGRLPFSRRTVKTIVRPGTLDVPLLGTDANVRLLYERLTKAGYPFQHLHLSCHAALFPSSPLLGGLYLHAEDDDGLLSVEEVSKWGYRTMPRLVVLAACESGLGIPIPCEGEDGLVRAFLLDGARYVVASLWEVDDRSTSDLMISFYRHIREEGLSPVEALRKAQHDVRDANEGKTAAPYYWAGWAVWGPRS